MNYLEEIFVTYKFSEFFPHETSFTFISFEINEVSISRKKKKKKNLSITETIRHCVESFAAYDVDQGVERSKIFFRVSFLYISS